MDTINMTGQHTKSPSRSLLANLQDQCPIAWARFIDVYSPLVYRWIRRSGVREADAGAVCHEVLGEVLIGLDSFSTEKSRRSFREWLYNLTKSRIAGTSNAHEQPSEIRNDPTVRAANVESLPSDGDDPAALNTQSVTVHRMLACLEDEFEPIVWQAFTRATTGRQNAQSVAQSLGISQGAVYTAKWRVLKRLRVELLEEFDDVD